MLQALENAKPLQEAYSPSHAANLSEGDCSTQMGAGVSPAPLHGMSPCLTGEASRAFSTAAGKEKGAQVERDPSKLSSRPFTAEGKPRVITGGSEARNGVGRSQEGMPAPEDGGGWRLQSLALPREKRDKRQAWLEVRWLNALALLRLHVGGILLGRVLILEYKSNRRCDEGVTKRR